MENDQINAFVTVYLEGLMISCFNHGKGRFETAILRKSDHDFSIRILKFKGQNKITDDLYDNFPLKGLKFEIWGSKNPEIKDFTSFKHTEFFRQNELTSHQNDIRWIVDLEGEEFHNTKLEPTGESESKYDMPLTPLFIRNANFFVNGLTSYNNEKIEKDENEKVLGREFFGRYGFILEAEINAEVVSLNFSGSEIGDLNFAKEDGDFNYKVYITNTREGGDQESELPIYYKVVKEGNGRHFMLEKIEPEVELYWRDGNCGKIFLGQTETIENLS